MNSMTHGGSNLSAELKHILSNNNTNMRKVRGNLSFNQMMGGNPAVF